ncbi:MAG TPA: response regulator [Clostridia bacterium]|nr:response regulator [Clostridia bacterium]
MCKVLLADDEYLERAALKIIFHEEMKDMTVVGEASNGIRAVELCEAHDPDLIFMDIKMPGMDGLEATEIIKNRDKEKVVIILTAYDNFGYAQKALKAGADDYILKPARPADIVEAVRKHQNRFNTGRSTRKLETGELIHQIHMEDYRDAKEELKSVVKQLIETYGKDLELLKQNAQLIVKRMLEVSEIKGLNRLPQQRGGDGMVEAVTPYNVSEKLFMVLDQVFSEIIQRKTADERNTIQTVLNYIEKKFEKGITLEEAADHVHLSPHYLSRLFKKEMHINFIDYVVRRKMDRAKELLESTGLPVINIAMLLSYEEPNYFSRVFKKVTGMTPSEYRERAEKEDHLQKKRNGHIPNAKWYI